MPAGPTTTIFVSYRREDTSHAAGRLSDRLNARFDRVFMDIDTIDPGVDFTAEIRRAVGECDVLVALIGDRWTGVVDQNGQRRLENPDDWIVQEIQVALDRGIRVIPALVDGARMPTRIELPDELAPLATRNAVNLRHNSFAADADRLIAAIERVIAGQAARDRRPAADQQSADPAFDSDYVPAVEAYFAQRWEQAVELLAGLLGRFPDEPGLADKLNRARGQLQLANLDAEAQHAVSTGRWGDAVRALEQIVAVDPDYRNAAERLVETKGQWRIASLQADLRTLHAGGHWGAVVAAGEELAKLDPGAGDPDDLVTEAGAQLAEADLAARYATGIRELDQGALAQAVTTFEGVLHDRPDYRDAAALLARARQRGRPAPAASELFVPKPRKLRVGQGVSVVAFSPDGGRLATGSPHRVRVWDLRTGNLLWERKIGGWMMEVCGVAFGPDGGRLATCGDDNTVRIWDVVTGAEQLKVTRGNGVCSVAFSPDGSRLATGSLDGTARIWDVVSGAEQLKITHDKSVSSVMFSPDGSRLATCSEDNTARIWDVVTGVEQLKIAHGNRVWSGAFSPDGSRLATGSWDNTARIWDVVTGVEQLKVAHGDGVHTVAFSPDGSRLATGSWDNTARIWDVVTGVEQLKVTHGDGVNSVAFSPDGTRLATVGDDKTARIWDVSPGSARGQSERRRASDPPEH